jgi:hypothetical protein
MPPEGAILNPSFFSHDRSHTPVLDKGFLRLARRPDQPQPLEFASRGPVQDRSGLGGGWPYNTVANRKARGTSIGRVDIDSDLDYDGVISNDGKESGDQESTPPGLVIGHKQMAKIVFRVTPYGATGLAETDASMLVCSLEVRALNQSRSNGQFASEEAATKASGHLRIWADDKRSRLLLDSRDKSKCRVEWKINAPDAPAFVYAECAEPASVEAVFSLMLSIDDTRGKTYAASKINPYASRDWMLITARSQPQEIKQASDAANARRLPGHVNYYSFSKQDKDGLNVWVKD